jgi:hypothetical protein
MPHAFDKCSSSIYKAYLDKRSNITRALFTNDAVKAKHKQSIHDSNLNEQTKINRSNGIVKLWQDDNYRQNVINRRLETYKSEEFLAKKSEISKRVTTSLWSNEDFKNKVKEGMRRANLKPEVHRRRSESAKLFASTSKFKERVSKASTFTKIYKCRGIFKYLEPFSINEFTFEDWHHFIIQKNGNVIVFLWDTREVVFQCNRELLKDGYIIITKFDKMELLQFD